MGSDKDQGNKMGSSAAGQFDRGTNSIILKSAMKEALAEPELILTPLAQDYYSISFPNPSRAGCVPLHIVVEAARSKRIVSGDWCGHLFTCSECFREYTVAPTHIRALLKLEAGKSAMYKFLEAIKFFLPSDELSASIISHNLKLAELDHQQVSHESAGEELREHWSRLERREDSYLESSQRWQDFVDRQKELQIREIKDPSAESDELIRIKRLTISDTLYGYLAVLSRQPEAHQGNLYDVWTYISRGMGSRLGLLKPVTDDGRLELEANKFSVSDEVLFDDYACRLLKRLTAEFSRWLAEEHGRVYKAPWGEMELKGGDRYLLFRAAPRQRTRKVRPYTADISYEVPPKRSERRVRK